MWRSLASALDWGSRGRRFESGHPDQGPGTWEQGYSPDTCQRKNVRGAREHWVFPTTPHGVTDNLRVTVEIVNAKYLGSTMWTIERSATEND